MDIDDRQTYFLQLNLLEEFHNCGMRFLNSFITECIMSLSNTHINLYTDLNAAIETSLEDVNSVTCINKGETFLNHYRNKARAGRTGLFFLKKKMAVYNYPNKTRF